VTASSKRPSRKRKPSSENGFTSRNGADGPAVVFSAFGRAFVKRVRNDDSRYGLLKRRSSILIACSGGPDSIALLHILIFLRDKLGLRIGVAHVNYGIRGSDADSDESLVESLCHKFGIHFFVLHASANRKRNEETLRNIRYRFFEEVREREAFDSIATAHTEDDQAETFLMRLLRGTGPEGLASMRPRNGRIIRPFLGIAKRDILDFLRKEGIAFHEDVTNRDTTILRNRIRHELLPLLENGYRPGIRKTLARTAGIFAKEFPKAAGSETPRITTTGEDGMVIFSKKDFVSLPEALRDRELRRLYVLVTADPKPPTESFVREVGKLLGTKRNDSRKYRSGRLKIETKGDIVTLIRIS